jgi:hypothetical protein
VRQQRGYRKLFIKFLMVFLGVYVVINSGSESLSHNEPDSPLDQDREEWILKKIATGEVADLNSNDFPGYPNRMLEGRFLERLLTSDTINVHRKGIRIANGIVTDSIDLELAIFPHEVRLTSFHFQNRVNFREAVFLKGVSFTESTFDKAADFSRITVEHSAVMDNARFNESVDFAFSVIKGNFEARSTRFVSKKDDDKVNMSEAVGCNADHPKSLTNVDTSFYGIEVGGHALYNQSVFVGPVFFVFANIGGNLTLSGSRFLNSDQQTLFNGIKIDGSVRILNAHFEGPVDFTLADIALNLNAQNAQFDGDGLSVNFDSVKIGETAFFEGTCFTNQISLDNMMYHNISAGDQDEEASLKRLLELLARSVYGPNVYATLEEFFRK